MLTLPTGQQARYLGASRQYHDRVAIAQSDGSWIDVTPFLVAFMWTDDPDAGAQTGTLTLRREARIGGVLTSLSPLVSASPMNAIEGAFSPLVNPFRLVRYRVAVTAPGVAAVDADFVEVFTGVIDDPEFGGKASRLTVPVRDLAARLQDTLIEEARDYGAPQDEGGIPIQTVLQQLLNDNGFAGLSLEVVGNPEGLSLGPYRQDVGVSTWDAMRTLALTKMGWDVRFWRQPDGTYAPTLLDPTRDTNDVSLTLTTAQFLEVPSLKLNGTDVRNAGQITYTDKATGARVTLPWVEDAGSIAAFGRRVFGLSEDATSPIDTLEEATDLITRAVADLSTPYLEQAVVLPFCPFLQIRDVLEFPAVGTPYYDALQRFGISGITHEVTATGRKTTAQLRGRPIGAYRRWLVLLGVPLDPDAPTPTFVVTASGSPDGGLTKDGSVWVDCTFEKNTASVVLASNTGPALPLEDPDDSDNTRNYILRRPDGYEAVAAYRTTVRIATTHLWWRNLLCYGLGYRGRRGAGFRALVQAIDGAAGFTPNGFDSFIASRTAGGLTALLTWTGTPSPGVTDEQIFVYRNGVRVASLPPEATEVTLTPIDPASSYTFEIARFAQGIEGPRRIYVLPADTDPLSPVFVGGTPILGLTGTTRWVQLAYLCTDPGAVSVRAEASTDGFTYGRVVGTSTTLPAGTFEDTTVTRQYYRLVSLGTGGVVRAISGAALFPGLAGGDGTTTTGAAATFRLALTTVSGAAMIRLTWTCPDPAAVAVRVQQDDGSGWIDLEDDTPASSGATVLDAAATFARYRLQTLDAGSAVLTTSAAQTWQGLAV